MTKVHVRGPRDEATSTVDSFLANLPEMLGAMKVDPRCHVAVVEFEDGRYVQFWVTSDGAVSAEVVSNLNIGDAVALTPEHEEMLRANGWEEPSPGPTPNWRFEAFDATDLIALVAMTRDAVIDVLGERKSRRISMRAWTVESSGDRPTSDLLFESRVYYQEALRDIESRLHET
jgi:hypothetical protein